MRPDTLGKTQRLALLAAYRSPNKALTRGRGGWWVGQDANGKPASFTARTVYAMGRAWLLDVLDPSTGVAALTTQGRTLAEQLHAHPAQQDIAA